MVRSRTARPVRPRHMVVAEPGARLRDGIEAVLRELDQPVVDDVNRLTGTLRGCLAQTAALGETCQVPGPAEAARIAAQDLSMGRLDDARLALTQALGLFGPLRTS
ncbi:hypothetical protein [Actinocrispum sp. NPDC049592]|uniref:hypothetical protein n=1 Tax=Actinocrispum sp. NPDC049592 TaxID=3154835 RepID=UPI00343792D3